MTDIDALVANLIARPDDRARKNALLDWCEDKGYEVRIEWRTDANLEVRYWVPGSGEFVATNLLEAPSGQRLTIGPHRLWGEGNCGLEDRDQSLRELIHALDSD